MCQRATSCPPKGRPPVGDDGTTKPRSPNSSPWEDLLLSFYVIKMHSASYVCIWIFPAPCRLIYQAYAIPTGK
jgi:hypothetical protein